MKILSLFRKKKSPVFMITIPDPCGEVWSEMKKVDDCHRHCASCDRILTDFARMSDDELMIFFKQSQGKICGRFRKDQLNRPLTPLAEKISKANWWKAAMLLPLTFFSKSSSAQQLPVDSTKTEQVPYMVANPDTLTPVTNFQGWNWADTLWESQWPHYEVTGGVPMILYEWDVRLADLSYCTITVSLPPAPPPPEVAAGTDAADSVAPKKIPGFAEAAGFANNFHAVSLKKEE